MKRTALQGTWKTPPQMMWGEAAVPTASATEGAVHGGNSSTTTTTTTTAHETKLRNLGLSRNAAVSASQNNSTSIVGTANEEASTAPILGEETSETSTTVAQQTTTTDASSSLNQGTTSSGKKITFKSILANMTEEERKVHVEKTREIARVRRQLQRDFTSSLDAELFELHFMIEYLRFSGAMHAQVESGSTSNAAEVRGLDDEEEGGDLAIPLDSARERVYRSGEFGAMCVETSVAKARALASAKSLQFVAEHAPKGIKDKKLAAPEEERELPTAFTLASEAMAGDPQYSLHLASAVCSRREGSSSLEDRRRTAVSWVARAAVETVGGIAEDALPIASLIGASVGRAEALGVDAVSVASVCASRRRVARGKPALPAAPGGPSPGFEALDGAMRELDALLGLTPEQRARVASWTRSHQDVLVKSLALERVNQAWLASLSDVPMKCTSSLLRHLIDNVSQDQLDRFLSWSTENEKMLLSLQLGPAPHSAMSSSTSSSSSSSAAGVGIVKT